MEYKIKSIRDIDDKTEEGRLLISALSRLTVRVDMTKTPDEVLLQVSDTAKLIYEDR